MEYAKIALREAIERHRKDMQSFQNEIDSLEKQQFAASMKVQELTEVLRGIDRPPVEIPSCERQPLAKFYNGFPCQ